MANYKETGAGEFPGGPVVKTLALKAGGMGSIPCLRTKILHAIWGGKKKKGRGLEETLKRNKDRMNKDRVRFFTTLI